jgi:hypothetical protein
MFRDHGRGFADIVARVSGRKAQPTAMILNILDRTQLLLKYADILPPFPIPRIVQDSIAT